jgi:hypothetical protein
MNTLKIYSGRKVKVLYFHSDFLKHREPIVLNILRDRLEVTRPSIDHHGITYMPQQKACGSYTIQVVSDFLPMGNFLIDEEDSNDDKLVVYFTDTI